jgi:hypothetical protein
MTKKVVAIGLATGLILGAAGVAVAYFTSTGTGTGTGTVGSPTSWGVSAGAATGTMYPGHGSSSIVYTITNNGSGNQAITGLTAAMGTSGTNATHGGVAISGCLAAWFTPVVGTPSPALNTSIQPGSTATVTVTVSMTDAAASQNSCAAAAPDVTLSVS